MAVISHLTVIHRLGDFLMAKYKYDNHTFGRDARSYSAGIGSTNKRWSLRLFKKDTLRYPDDIHMVIRRPDNVLLAFYHPFKDLEIDQG